MSSAEANGVGYSREDEVNSREQQSHSDSSKDSTGPPSTAEESNDMTLSASSNTSNKYEDQQDLDNSDKKSLDNTHVSNSKTRKEKPKIKAVQSRYKAAAAAKGGNSSGGSSSSSRSWSNETLITGPPPVTKRLPPKTRPMKARPEDMSRSRVAAPSIQSTTTTTQPSTSKFQTPQKSEFGSATKSKPAKTGGSKSASRAILHSTALNTTLMGDVTAKSTNMLSSTLLGGITPMGFKHMPAGAGLMELPDLSLIKPEGNNSGNKTILSSVHEEAQVDSEGTTALPEVTAEVLEQEYMKYLQWVYVDVNSDLAFTAQVKELQNQIVFLEELVSEKQEEVSELQQKTDLFMHHQRVGKASEVQSKLLHALIDNLPACEVAEKTMERELEKKLHQVKMENIYIPQDHVTYREELTEALNTQISLLQELEGMMEPRTRHGNATIKLLAQLQDITELVQRCEKEMQQAAGLAMEDASHQLGAKPISLDAEFAK